MDGLQTHFHEIVFSNTKQECIPVGCDAYRPLQWPSGQVIRGGGGDAMLWEGGDSAQVGRVSAQGWVCLPRGCTPPRTCEQNHSEV